MSRASPFLQAMSMCMLIVSAGCSRKADEPAAPAPASAPVLAPTNQLSSGAIDETPAESGLAIKRGIATAAGDHGMFRSCDDKVDLWLIDEADGALTQLLTEEPSTHFYVEAYGERGPVPEALTAAKGQAGAFT